MLNKQKRIIQLQWPNPEHVLTSLDQAALTVEFAFENANGGYNGSAVDFCKIIDLAKAIKKYLNLSRKLKLSEQLWGKVIRIIVN